MLQHFAARIRLFSILLFIASCGVDARNEFDVLPIPSDSSTFYFKMKPDLRDTTAAALDTFANTWYSGMLFALKEPVLKDYKGDKEIYRFTWLRTFHHPVVVRVEKQGETVRLFCKVCDGAGGYEPGKVIVNKTLDLSQKQADSINYSIDESTFWTLITELHEGGADGSEWIVEAIKNNRYHMVVRWTPEGGKFRKIGEYLLSLADIKNETTERNYY